MYKVYVGCLPASCTAEQLSELFSRYGTVVDAKVSRKPGSKLCSGNGTFACSDKASFDAIIAKRTFDLNGRVVFCEGKLTGEELILKNQLLSRKRVYLSNLPSNVTDQEIEDSMRAFGPVQNGYRIKSLANKPRPFGFVTFMDEPSAERAIELGFILLKDQIVYISPFKKSSTHAGKEKDSLKETFGVPMPTFLNYQPIAKPTPCRTAAEDSPWVPKAESGNEPHSMVEQNEIKPTSICYLSRSVVLNHEAPLVRYNLQRLNWSPPTFHSVSTGKNQTLSTTTEPTTIFPSRSGSDL